jgi:hypothetical protein
VLRGIHLGGAFMRKVSQQSTSKTAISGCTNIGVVVGVVVIFSSSRMLRHNLAVGVVFGGVISWGWKSLGLRRRP